MPNFNFTNMQIWNALRAKYKSFETLTSEATADTFSEKNWGAITRDNLDGLNAFFNLSMRVFFQKLDVAEIKTRLEESGIVEVFQGENGGYIQRMSMEAIAPISPKYLNIVNGQSVDPYPARKHSAKERFFECGNFNYQSLVTVQAYQVKTIFLNEFGMSSFLAGIMAGLENGYRYQKELNYYEAIHQAINSASAPLQDTQKLTLSSWTDAGVTDAELLDFIAQLQDLATVMETSITQKGFNANKFNTAVNPEDHVVLVRAGILNKIRRQLMVGAYNPENLTIPFKMLEVNDFGGLIPIDSNNVEQQPVFDVFGTVVGVVDKAATVNGYATQRASDGRWIVNITAGGVTADTTILEDGEYGYIDPNANVLAVVVQKGLLFAEVKEPYSVTPIHNPAGLYDNYWANQPNGTVNYDANYDCITISKPSA